MESTQRLWERMQRYSTLFNDLTRGDPENFARAVTQVDSLWVEVTDAYDVPCGMFYWTGMDQVVDCDVHVMFYDRRLFNKVPLSKHMMAWFFVEYPEIRRMTARFPSIFHATERLVKRVGFVYEGKKRSAQIIKGRVVDELMFGLLANEVK